MKEAKEGDGVSVQDVPWSHSSQYAEWGLYPTVKGRTLSCSVSLLYYSLRTLPS